MAETVKNTTYIISFELGQNGSDIVSLLNNIKLYGTWARITERTWAIVAINEKASDVRNKLLPFVGSDGRIFIIKSGYESAWHNTHARNEWLKKYLKN